MGAGVLTGRWGARRMTSHADNVVEGCSMRSRRRPVRRTLGVLAAAAALLGSRPRGTRRGLGPVRGRPTDRSGQPVHRHGERGQHLSGRRRPLRHGAVLARHRAQHRIRLLGEPHPRLLHRSSVRRGLRVGRRPARAADRRRHRQHGLREVRGRVQPRRREGVARLLQGRPEVRHRRRAERHQADRRAEVHVPGHRQGQRDDQRGPVAAQDRAHQGRHPRQPHRAHRHHRQRLLPGHQAVHALHDHQVRPALRHVRHLEGRHRHRGLQVLGRGRRAQRRVSPLRHQQGPHRRGDDRDLLRGRARRCAQPPYGGRPFLRLRAHRGPVRVGGPARRRQGTGRQRDPAPHLLLLAVPLVPRAEHRQRRRRPLHRLGPEDPPRQGIHVLPELVALGHVPYPGAVALAAGSARVAGHGAVGDPDRQGQRLAAQVGLRHGRDEHHDR